MGWPVALVQRAALLGSLLAAPSTAAAFEIKHTTDGAPVRWPAGAVELVIALDDGPRGVDPALGWAAAEAAIATWNQVLIPHGVELVGVRRPGSLATDPRDGENRLRWALAAADAGLEPGVLAMTHLRFAAGDGAVQDADVVMNGAEHGWTAVDERCAGDPACRQRFDLQSTLTHELGHLLGLSHSSDRGAAMYAEGRACDASRRALGADDRAAIEHLYGELAMLVDPRPDALAGCGTAVGGGRAGMAFAVLALVGVGRLRRRSRR